MVTVFEDEFSSAQTEMISLAFSFANDHVSDTSVHVSDVFVWFYIWEGSCSGNAFYTVDGSVRSSDELLAGGESGDQVFALLHSLAREARRIELACKEFSRPVPVEGYLRHRVNSRSLDAQYSYEEVRDDEEDPLRRGKLADWKRAIQDELGAEIN